MKTTFYLSIIFSVLTFVLSAQKTNESTKFEPLKESEKPASLMKTETEKHPVQTVSSENHKANEKSSFRRIFADKSRNVMVEVKEANGQKKMRLTEVVDGQRRVTQYVGAEVDKKLKELETQFPSSKQ